MTAAQNLDVFRKTLSNEENLVLEYQLRALSYLRPFLENQFRLEEEISQLVKMKEGDNSAFGYDLAINDIFLDLLKEYSYQGSIYSEESGWEQRGLMDEVIVTDPVCNSSLLRRGFRNVASGVTFFRGKEFVAGALTDFGSYTICLANQERVLRLMVFGESVVVKSARVSGQTDLNKAFVYFSLLRTEHRTLAIEKSSILKKIPLIVEVVGGQPNWARLTQGYIDAYVNPFYGTKIYEGVSAEIAKRAGAVVKDLNGKEINMGEYLDHLRNGVDVKIKFIAAASEELYDKIRVLL